MALFSPPSPGFIALRQRGITYRQERSEVPPRRAGRRTWGAQWWVSTTEKPWRNREKHGDGDDNHLFLPGDDRVYETIMISSPWFFYLSGDAESMIESKERPLEAEN